MSRVRVGPWDNSIRLRMLSLMPPERGGVRMVAEEVGVSPQLLSQYLHGIVRVPSYVLARFADARHVSLRWLLLGDDEHDPMYRQP